MAEPWNGCRYVRFIDKLLTAVLTQLQNGGSCLSLLILFSLALATTEHQPRCWQTSAFFTIGSFNSFHDNQIPAGGNYDKLIMSSFPSYLNHHLTLDWNTKEHYYCRFSCKSVITLSNFMVENNNCIPLLPMVIVLIIITITVTVWVNISSFGCDLFSFGKGVVKTKFWLRCCFASFAFDRLIWLTRS